jgi:hypothetical protein
LEEPLVFDLFRRPRPRAQRPVRPQPRAVDLGRRAAHAAGAAGTGDATAVGNRSGTQANQGGAASTSGSNLQIINQNAGVANVGVAVANTGGNVAVGNASNNLATANQTAGGGPLGIAVNNGNAANSSNGSAFIQTGAAYAMGNESNTTVDQRFDAQAHGTLGGVLVLSQNAGVANAGFAVSNTGINGAVGNASGRNPLYGSTPNTAGILQRANNNGDGPGGATNSGSATNDSNGKATIQTGNASSTGNRASTTVTQAAGSGAGDDPDAGGLTVITQLGGALNAGAALANTGVNGAVGNVSTNSASVGRVLNGNPIPQDAQVDFDPGIGLANNSGSATNASDGTAWITTGDATATGNDSRTAIVQDATADFGDQGVNIQTQLAPVVNIGLAASNTGVNGAVGNASYNEATTDQRIGVDMNDSTGLVGFGVISNQGEAANSSDGTAEIHTGDAWSRGNWSDDHVHQTADADGSDLAVQTQVGVVANVGIAVANSGVNGAIGNASQNEAHLGQNTGLDPDDPTVGIGTVTNSGSASNDSDGTASITTGDTWASGNESTTDLSQTIDPTGLAVQTQAGLVLNAGLAVSNSGVNGAVGNVADNANPGDPTPGDGVVVFQENIVDGDPTMLAGVVTVNSSGEAGNVSDGTASISTGDAWSLGNKSRTNFAQDATASTTGLGGVVNSQVGVVANVGAGVANSGVNGAIGNESSNRMDVDQNNFTDGQIATGVLTSSASASAVNESDGTATITTGDTKATGNVSTTDFRQSASGSVDGLGIVVNTQAGGVVNAGAGIANSGVNVAVGNDSDNEVRTLQQATIEGPGGGLVVAPVVTNANQVDATNASDGTAEIHTGRSEATGNSSDTRFTQEMDGDVDGLGAVVNTQLGGVANVGLAVANSGVNGAVGNLSNNDIGDFGPGTRPGLTQLATMGNDGNLIVPFGAITNGNFASATNASDGYAAIHTGETQAQGNVSATNVSQQMRGSVGEGAIGIVPNLQVGGVLNLGVGVANSGVNGAIGNASGSGFLPPLVPLAGVGPENQITVLQDSTVQPGGTDLTVLTGALTNTNTAELRNDSDGTAKVFTGAALATGNVSTSNFSQRVDGDVDGLGLVVGPQLGLIANVGVGVANSGVNGSIGNLSNNSLPIIPNTTFANNQVATFDTDDPAVALTGVTVGNNGSFTNSSDGEACVCTGNAVATGNVSTSTLSQDLEIGVDDGLSVVPMTGVILNAGFGLANSGVNGAVGNWSQNLATTNQVSTLDPDAGIDLGGTQLLVGPQTIVNGGGADNASDGTGKVGTGNARADGNISTSDLSQAVDVDGAGAFAVVNGGIGNVGAGIANSGVNAGIGNASTNEAHLLQSATGEGTVANQGRASNRSDGFGGVGDPNCDIPGETPGTPGVPTLPRTGGPLEVEAAVGLMLLLAGYGFRRAGRRAAQRA